MSQIITTTEGAAAKANAVCRNRTTRIIHKFGGGRSRCGASVKNVLVGLSEVEAASASMFCEKCFPNGKPEKFFELAV